MCHDTPPLTYPLIFSLARCKREVFYSVSYPERYLQRDASADNAFFAAFTNAQTAIHLYRADSTEIQTVTFDANGGECPAEKQTMKFVVGREYWWLVKPTWAGHQFLGWYDAQTGGTRIQNGMPILTPASSASAWSTRNNPESFLTAGAARSRIRRSSQSRSTRMEGRWSTRRRSIRRRRASTS